MNSTDSNSASADLRKKKREREIVDLLGVLTSEMMKSPRAKKVMLAVLDDVFVTWSKQNFAKRKLSDQAMKIMVHLFDPESLSRPKIEGKDIGRLITLLVQNVNEQYIENPMCLVHFLEGPLNGVIENTDFGELKEMLDRSEEPVVELVKRLINFVWNTYPAKLGTVMSFIHPLGNMAVRSAKEIILPLNGITPDLFADLIFAIVGSIDGKQIGGLANALMELIRQINTGSLLQGESGVSQFQIDLTNKLREIMAGIDQELFCKIKVITAEMAEEKTNAVANIMTENPALVLGVLSRFSSIQNPKIRKTEKRINVYERLPKAEFIEAFSKGVSEIDTQGTAEIANSLLRLMNSIHESKPDIFSRFFSDIVHSLDEDELKTATDWILEDIVDAIKPIADTVIPSLVNGLKKIGLPAKR